jgi:hypothetical protein
MGLEADELLGTFDTLKEEDIWQYRYPDDAALNAVGVRGIYLGNYLRWDPKAQHEQMIAQYDYRTARYARSFEAYDHVDCWNHMDLHDQLKLHKHGYGKVTDHASREIRHGRLTREQGLALVRQHELQPVQHAQLFCDWLGLDPSGLQFMMDRARSPLHWDSAAPGHYRFKGPSTDLPASPQWTTGDFGPGANFIANDVFAHDGIEGYVTVGKGHP